MKINQCLIICYCFFCLIFNNVFANYFDRIDANVRYKEITTSLRCLICQNQSVADSNADFAKDIRKKVIKLIKHGYSDKKIVNFFIQRYGEYIYYQPVFDYRTVLLWLGPFLIVLLGVGCLFRRAK